MSEKNSTSKDKKKGGGSSKKNNSQQKSNSFNSYSSIEEKNDGYLEDLNKNKWSYSIVFSLIFLVVATIYMQYKFEMHQRSFRGGDNSDEIDYWDVLGLTEGASQAEIKKAYKELAKIWHPDKNPGCASCAEKFKLIAKAEEVLKSSDSNKAGKSLFKSNPYFLTTTNFHKLVEESNDFWVIVIYEGQQGSQFNQYIADAYDEVAEKYKSIIKFGVIDVLKHPNLLHYIPYKFQYFPNIFTLQHGESELMENLDVFSVTTLLEFIENSYINKVELLDDYGIKSLITPYENAEVVPLDYNIKVNNIFDSKVLVLSSKNFIDLVVKDQAKFYENEIQVFQNELGHFDKVSLTLILFFFIYFSSPRQ